MEINSNTSLTGTPAYTPASTSSGVTNNDSKLEIEAQAAQEAKEAQGQNDKEQLPKEDIIKMTGELNKIMQLLNADLQFAIHEKTQRIMIQLTDTKQQKVLREFPPHELLDTIAKIRDYIGFLLDKKV